MEDWFRAPPKPSFLLSESSQNRQNCQNPVGNKTLNQSQSTFDLVMTKSVIIAQKVKVRVEWMVPRLKSIVDNYVLNIDQQPTLITLPLF